MIKGFKKLFITFALVAGLLVQTLPAQAATTGRNLQDRTGLEPMVEVPLDPNTISHDKFFNNTYSIKEADREYWTKFGTDFYYNQLNSAEKSFWDGLENVCLTYATTSATYPGKQVVTCDSSITLQRMKDIMFNFIYSNPQYYFLDASIGYYPSGGGGTLYFYDAFLDGAARTSTTAQFTAKIDAWVAEIQTYATPEQKLKAAHDLICLNTVYAKNDYDQSAYSMVCLGQTVCAGYTKTLTILGNAVGVETSFETSLTHAWNTVNLYGVWYEVDATWADPDDGTDIYYDYYCKSRDTFLAVDSTWDDESHITESMYDGMLAYTPYDLMDYYTYYVNPYFTVGGNTYFTVNCNSSLGEPIVRLISGSSPLPATVTYYDVPFTVIGAASGYTGSTAGSDAVAQVNAFVERMYTVALGRSAGSSEISYWANQLISGENDGAGIASGFILSSEFKGRNYSNTQFIQVLYKTFLNREADAEGNAYWSGLINSGMTREAVLAGFVNSNEFFDLCSSYGISKGVLRENGTAVAPGICQFAERLYTMVLERDGEKIGMEYWALRIADGVSTPEEAAKGFFTSEEYLGKQTNDERYIMALYRTFMNRESEADGLIYWKNQLGKGASRDTALSGFAQSNEFKAIMAEYGL